MSTENKLTQDQIEQILRLNTEACARIFEAQQKQALELARLQMEENREVRKDTREGLKSFCEFLMTAVPPFFAFVEAQEEKRRAHITAMEKSRQEHEERMQELKRETALVASGRSPLTGQTAEETAMEFMDQVFHGKTGKKEGSR